METNTGHLLTVRVILPTGAIHLARLVDAEKELVGRIETSKADVTLEVVVAARVPLQCPRAVCALCQCMKGVMPQCRWATSKNRASQKEQGQA